MPKASKKHQAIAKKVKPNHMYTISEAVEVLQEFQCKKFKESVDAAVVLGIDPTKSDQAVRSSVHLPKGTGKEVRVAVFAQGENAEKAKAAGADIVGFEDLAEKVKAGELEFDVVIATPDAMRLVGQLGQILGPRNLMPNPKVGTVTPNVEAAVRGAKSGQVRYRADKNGIIHCSIGKVDFKSQDIQANLAALMDSLKKVKPASAKGVYFKKVYLSSTMGPGLPIDIGAIFE